MTTDDPQAPAPVTDDPEIDAALTGLDDLPETPLADHADRLAGVHEVLQRSLDRADPAASD